MTLFALMFLGAAALGPMFGLHQLKKQNLVLEDLRQSSRKAKADLMARDLLNPDRLLAQHQDMAKEDPEYLGFRRWDPSGALQQEALIAVPADSSLEVSAENRQHHRISLFFRPLPLNQPWAALIMGTSYIAAALGVMILVFGWGRRLLGLQQTATARAQEFGLPLDSKLESGGDLAAFNQVLEAAVATLRKREEELLKVQDAQTTRLANLEQALDFIIEKTGLPLLVLDENNHLRKVSAQACSLLKLENPAADRQLGAWCAPLGKALQDFSSAEDIRRGALQDAVPGLVLGYTALQLSRKGVETPSTLVILEDLTAQQARERAERARSQLVATGEMAAEVAHEVRNSLGTILAHLRLLENSTNPEQSLQELRQEVDHVNQLTQTYLANARPLEPSWGHFSLQELLDKTLSDLKAEGLGKQHEQKLKGDFPTLNGDSGLWARALDNIFRNAFQAMDERGPGKLTIHGYPENGNFVLAIEDQGKGLSTDRPSDIFKPFVTTKEEGTGLGLSMTRKIIEAHDGHIRAMEAPGGGLILLITIPRERWRPGGGSSG